MKKTLTVNISGTVYHIEEDAYEALNRYLANIRGQFDGSPGRDEIMADIESRIAELFTERLEGRGEVVTLADVEHVIGVMGQPEDYMAPGGDDNGPETARGRRYKRLFRDPDDRWIGGVLGGIAAYIGMDPLWLRLAFIALLVLGVGSPVVLYILLWILIPVASSAADRLMMEGEPVTVDNLKRTFEEGTKRVANEVDELGKKWSGEEGKKHRAAFRSHTRRAATGTAEVIGRVVGLVLLVIGVGLAVSLLSAVVGGGVIGFGSGLGLYETAGLIFASTTQALWFALALFLVMLIPVIGILTAGLQLLLGLRAPRWLGWTLVPLWIIALIAAIFIGARLGSDFRRTELLRNEVHIDQPVNDVLHLHPAEILDAYSSHWGHRGKRRHMGVDLDFLDMAGDSVRGAWARLDVRRSPDDKFHLLVERRTQARNAKTALHRSGNISIGVHQDGDVLTLSPWLAWPKADKIRGQRIRFVVQVPLGKAVRFHEDIGFMLDDVKNVTNTLDRDMVGRTWTMTPHGLSKEATPGEVTQPAEVEKEEASEEEEAPPAPAEISLRGKAIALPAWSMPDLFLLLRPGRLG